MKKIIFLLLLSVAIYGQQTNFPYGIKNPAATSDSAPAYFTTTQVDGVHKKTPAALVAKTATVNDSLATKENVANKSDSYTSSSSTTYASTKALVDGLDLKAVDANVLHKTGEETIGLGEKYFTDNVNFTYIAVSGQAIGRAAVSPNEFVIKSQLDLKAVDANVLHKTGNETKTGTLTINNPAGGGSYFTGTQSGSGADRFLIKLFNNGSVNSAALRIDNQSDAYGFNLGNNSTGIGGYIGNNSNGTGFKIDNSSMGVGFILNNGASATGDPFVVAKNNVAKLIINDSGEVTAPKFLKSGGTSSQFLKADGSVDSNNYIINNTSITGATNTKITYDSKGLVTSGTSLVAGDIPNIAQSQVNNLTSDLALKAPLSSLTNTQNYLVKYGLTGQLPSRILDTGTYLGIGTANAPTKDFTLGNQANREIGVEQSASDRAGRDLKVSSGRTINYALNSNFNSLNQIGRNYRDMATAPNGDIYVINGYAGVDVYVKRVESDTFVETYLGNDYAYDTWRSICVLTNGNVIAMNSGGTLYRQIGGTGAWSFLVTITGITGSPIEIRSDNYNNLYLVTSLGYIYKQTNATGSFVQITADLRPWSTIGAQGTDLYAKSGSTIYKQTGGVGSFVAIAGSFASGKMVITNGGSLYIISEWTIYYYPTLTSSATVLYTGAYGETFYGITEGINGNIYVARSGAILMQQNDAVGVPNLSGGSLDLVGGSGKGTGNSNLNMYTGQKTTSGTDMQIQTLRATINNEGLMTLPSTTNAIIDADVTGKAVITKEWVEVKANAALTVRKISTNTTLADSDNGKVILLTASCTVTLPNGLMSGFNCSFSTLAGATLTYSLGGSVVLLNNLGTTMAEKLSHTIVNTGVSNEYLIAGAL